ncbi:hypothetical protein V494_06397 [Pseudogymnoascus sp. VKM F-4513 (FW-928)]|nr:hypothetical protein V494_06397 [Pseudogymnoascus sp. VKM F-4513 (FW-928)]
MHLRMTGSLEEPPMKSSYSLQSYDTEKYYVGKLTKPGFNYLSILVYCPNRFTLLHAASRRFTQTLAKPQETCAPDTTPKTNTDVAARMKSIIIPNDALPPKNAGRTAPTQRKRRRAGQERGTIAETAKTRDTTDIKRATVTSRM